MANSRPNIIICMCDQLRAVEVGCYGNDVIRTPNIDRLASEGVRFETAVSNCPVCMPGRSITLSGQYSRSCTGTLNNAHDWLKYADTWTMTQYPVDGRPHLPEQTLPECLSDAGYATAAIGKWHIHSWPNDIGFDHYLIPRVFHCHSGQSFTEDGGPEFVPEGYSVDFEIDRVGQYLRDHANADEPFFLYYNISPPHCPLNDAPDHYLNMYAPEDIPLRDNVPVDQSGNLPADDEWFRIYRWDFKYYAHRLPHATHIPEGYDLRQLIASYYGLTTWVDDTVGKLMSHLDSNGLADDTLLIFCSDHGDMLGSHGKWQKSSLLDESSHIPMICRLPDRVQPSISTGQVPSLLDLAPTALGMVGLPIPGHMQGQDLSPVLQGTCENLECPHSFIEANADGIGIRTSTHLYGIPWVGDTYDIEDRPNYFFDMAADPYQLNNLVGTAEQAAVAAELDHLLRELHNATPRMAGNNRNTGL